MLRSIDSLVGYTISAKDGELGKVNEFFFDDFTWSIRYLVVETGTWLSDRKVLVPHAALGIPDWESRIFRVNLTVEQVRNSPDIETEKTVSRQHEGELLKYYALPAYWEDGFYAVPFGMVPFAPVIDTVTAKEEEAEARKRHDDPHLRSTKKVKGYRIHALDGEIGHVEDYIVNDEKWDIYFLMVDTHNWLPGRKVLVAPYWIDRIDWDESAVYINLSKDSIKNSPAYDSSKPITKDYERLLYYHYGVRSKQPAEL
jgi:hypothetical protein